jgi:hypothetical protein
MRNSSKITFGKLERNILLARHWSRLKINNKLGLKEVGYEDID